MFIRPYGVYQHGGFVGITNSDSRVPGVGQVPHGVHQETLWSQGPFFQRGGGEKFGNRTTSGPVQCEGHAEYRNSCGPYEQGGLWVEGKQEGAMPHSLELPTGASIEGSILPTENSVVKFNPKRLHKSMPWTGTKWTIIAYVNRGFSRLPEDGVQQLRDCGFLVPNKEQFNLHQLRLQEECDEFDYCDTSDEEELTIMGQAVVEDELVLLNSALDEEEKLEKKSASSEFEEETQAIVQANASAMMRCSRLESVAAREFQRDYVDDSMEWFRLCRMVEGDEQHGVEEVLRNLQSPLQVVYTMSLTEVRENVGAWRSAIKKEVDALISCGALVRMEPAEEDRLRRENRLVVLPSKGVFTVKPPDVLVNTDGGQARESANQAKVSVKFADHAESTEGVHIKSADHAESTEGVHIKSADQAESTEGVHIKSADQAESTEGNKELQTQSFPTVGWFKRKARLVICGNYEKHVSEDLYAGGCQTESLRVMVSHAAGRPIWDAAVTDIRNAFLLAPMATDAVYGLRFPKVFLNALGPEWDGLYRVDRALYGFRRSPRLWGLFRDARLRDANFKVKGRNVVLRRLTADENVWKVVQLATEGEHELVLAYLVIYVDDIMYLGETTTIQEVHRWLSSEWKASDLTWASSLEGIRFLGLEIYKKKTGYFMCQLGYLSELLRHHNLSNGPGAKTPCPREWLLGEVDAEQIIYDEATLRRAQRLTGELLWLSTKSRPDLMHAVASMSSLCLRDPILVERIGLRALAYLYTTAHFGLMFSAEEGNELQVAAYSDASFSPAGGRSVGCSAIFYRGNPVAWKAGRQSPHLPFHSGMRVDRGSGSLATSARDKHADR